ncbi:VOC family protein [Nocardia arthritidis]|uniref:3,4-dihydroxyphenylacetate 2,3-dioxygenase n=1 Tax=Nocardia arthritidis TaxID=228602 RepID=A0A6G9YLJ3_9NOCA|nr:VOC family protein [Nocardia arthritidis]QIS14010.1 3,4-dihydroxyphenylacetate 2,3-dioxygenase [Nocardia arthritidis]
MPLYPQDRDTGFDITRLNHLHLDVTDLAESRRFYEEFVGLVVTEATDDAVYLRGIEEIQHHSLVLHRAADAAVGRTGFRVAAPEDLDRLAEHFRARDLPTRFVDLPAQGRTLQVSDPQGVPVEFIAAMPVVGTRREVLDYTRKVGAAPPRFDHLQIRVPDADSAVEFWAGLGFHTSEAATATGDADEPLQVAFLERKGNANDIVFSQGPGPKLHHFAFVVHDAPVTMLHLLDTAHTHGFKTNVEYGPNRHSIGTETTMNLRDPDGHRVELLSHPYFVDADEPTLLWSFADPLAAVSLWGAEPELSWFTETSPMRGVRAREPETPTPMPGAPVQRVSHAG